ncbi:gliding motility-associated ABC transporter substrate-binding protein GldG [soil metagenome]
MLLGIGILVLVLINVVAHRFVYRIDLTEEKRYTISEATKDLLRDLEDVVYVEVYLEGEFPAGFQRLQRSVKETLEEFRTFGGKNIQYKFIDPATAKSGKARNEFYMGLAQKGIQPTNLYDTDKGSKIEKLIFPGAVVSYGGNEKGVMLLKGNMAAKADERLNQSVEGVEFELASAIRQVIREQRKRVAIIDGYGGPDSLQLAGLSNALRENYEVLRVNISKESLHIYDAIILARPVKPVSEQDKFKIDQFIMKGGKALFFIESMEVKGDSIGLEQNYALPYNHNLDDQFFQYGIRINTNLIQDLTSGAQPVVVGNMGDQPQIRMMPWPFYPVINSFSKHPIVKNLDAIYTKYISSMDTVKADGVTKIPLLFTSQYSRVLSAPVRVSINDIRGNIQQEAFGQRFLPVAYLLEGEFSSLYKNRILPRNVSSENFLASGNSKILVCSDGDLVSNEINTRSNQPYDLGYDPYSQYTFSNKEFVSNALEYLLDEKGLIVARTKEIKIRPLDKFKVENERIFWQIINLVLPVVIIIIFGISRYYIRKRKYANF